MMILLLSWGCRNTIAYYYYYYYINYNNNDIIMTYDYFYVYKMNVYHSSQI